MKRIRKIALWTVLILCTVQLSLFGSRLKVEQEKRPKKEIEIRVHHSVNPLNIFIFGEIF